MPETSSAWGQGLRTRRARTCVYGVECIFRDALSVSSVTGSREEGTGKGLAQQRPMACIYEDHLPQERSQMT